MDKFRFKIGKSRKVVSYEEIIFMEKSERRIILHGTDGCHIFYGKFTDIMPEMDRRFDNSHRSYLINMDYIREIGAMGISLSDGTFIGMGRKSLSKVRKNYDDYVDNYKRREKVELRLGGKGFENAGK